MHTQFHINWIAKQWLIDQIATACNLRKNVGTYVDGDRIERSKHNRRAVILSLVAEGFIGREPGETKYEVSNKVFGQIDQEEWTSGGVVLKPRADGFGLRDVSAKFLKTVFVGMQESRVTAQGISPNGEIALSLTAEAQTSGEQKAEQWVLNNLPALAHQLLDLSEASAQLVSLRGKTEGIPLNNLPLTIAKLTDECCGEINKLRMREEALLMLTMRVERAGGWDKFIAGCRAIQKLHVFANEPSKGEDALREAAELFKDVQARGQS